ncbi:MAG TPA: hypothetical protein VFW07_22095 [Parafilimonas sp.]|nr:hypothetical protein [Parafilimonas sp.]
MRIKIVFTVLSVCTVLSALAQKDESAYKKRAQDIQTEIWNTPSKEFAVKSVPAEMNNESAVIIATSFDVVNSGKMKMKFSPLGFGSVPRIYYQTTFHERVKINDKAALGDYSTLEYQKKLDKTVSVALIKLYNKTDTYIGAKIIKADGKEIMVNTGEEVLTKDENKKKESKLAIPDLQVGDILDYYIRTEKIQELTTETQGPYTFFLGGEYPILYQSIRLQLDEKSGAEYVTANNAPALKEMRDEDDNIILYSEQRNLPKIQSSLWTSSYRQYPYISLQYIFLTKGTDANSHFNRGEVKHGFLSSDLLDQFEKILESPALPVNYAPYNRTATYFGGEKHLKDQTQDTLVKTLYNAWRLTTFCDFSTTNIDITNDYNYTQANSLVGAISMSRMLRTLGIDHELVLVCPRTSNKLKDVMNLTDFEAMLHLKNGKNYWLAFNDIVTQFNEIPARLQGEEGLVFRPDVDVKKISYDQTGKIKIPVTTADKNTETENISVAFNPSNMQQLQIDRSTQLSGATRHYTQKELLMMEDMEAYLATSVNQKKLTERLADDKKQYKLVSEFSAAFAKEKTNQKSYFEDEIKNQYDQPAKEVTIYEVKNEGMFNSEFEYHTKFTMDNFVKKAGNNYIVEAGKLVGVTRKVEEKDRTRAIDVYMPYGRTYTYTISLSIPKGYKVKGIENFNKSINNESGSVAAIATTDDATVRITVKEQYLKNFEPATNWPKLLELMDNFYDISNQKLLLEKSN